MKLIKMSSVIEGVGCMIIACCGTVDVHLALYWNTSPIPFSLALDTSVLLILSLAMTDFLYFVT